MSKFDISWSVSGSVVIEAKNLKEAEEKIKELIKPTLIEQYIESFEAWDVYEEEEK